MAKVLGLDIGTNSIGWALIDDEKSKIVDTGVRIFQEGVNRTTSGSEESKNADRRIARGIRRQNARYRSRRDDLIVSLIKLQMYPKEKDEEANFYKIDPYEIREKGLDEKLTLLEIGRALFHINQRRGFKSNRKTATKEKGKIYDGKGEIAGITETAKAISEESYRTLGEYLAYLDPKEKRRRNRYTLRSMYSDEFNILWEKQRQFYPEILTDDAKNCIYDAIFFQRKLKSQKHTIGYCTFEPKKRCAPKSSPVFQYYRILEQVSRLTITTDNRFGEKLTDDERFLLTNELNERSELKFSRIKKILKLPPDSYFNLEQQKKLLGNRTGYEFAKAFGKKCWFSFSPEKKHEIWHTLHFSNDDEWLKKYASEKWGLDSNSVEKLMKVSLENGYARLSSKAMKNIIPFFEEGMAYDKAALEAGYHHSQTFKNRGNMEKLPEPENIRNPIVQQALYELRKVMNEIIEKYGKPNVIRVELLRELKLPKEKRENILLDNRRREKKANEIRARLKEELGFLNPSREDIQKYLLWEECNKICPYTGKQISLAGLYNGDFEIEHIIPYSRSLDNSMANKTLSLKELNLEKGNKTPFEAFSGDSERWDEIKQRVKKNMPWKLKKFTIEDAAEEIDDDFFHHQFTDSAYIAGEVHKYLKYICEKVQVAKGSATFQLRHLWGLDKILSGDINIKNRDDHRHHAVDALVIANITPGFLKKLSTYSKFGYEATHEKFPVPWENFRKYAGSSINNILVSHRVNKRVRGKLHKDTFYGKIRLRNGKETYVVRKPLKSLTPNMIKNIVDPVVRKTVLKRLRSMGLDTNKKYSIPKDAFTETLTMQNSSVSIKSVRVAITSGNMIRLYPDRNLYVEPGKNHHIEIFENETTGKRDGRVVTLFDAVKRKKEGLPIVDKNPLGKGYKFIMSLAINELVLIDLNYKNINWNDQTSSQELSKKLYRVQKISESTQITFRHHKVAVRKDEEGNEPGICSFVPNTLKGVKIKISPLGKIRMADD